MTSTLSSQPPSFTLDDKDNILIIIVNLQMYIFDGTTWTNIEINDMKVPGSDFPLLKNPSICEIYQSKTSPYSKVLMVTGGLLLQSMTSIKTVYILNLLKGSNNSHECLLDFKYSDMKFPRYNHKSVNILNKFIIEIGGQNEKELLNSCEILDINNGQWSPFANLPCPRSNFSLCLFNNNRIFLYGGFGAKGKFIGNDQLICSCKVDVNKLSNSTWENIKLNINCKEELPLVCNKTIQYENSIIVIGGSNGKGLLNGVFDIEIDENEGKCEFLGGLQCSRSNGHLLERDGYFYFVGGNVKDFKFNDGMTHITNYYDKFTIGLNNDIEGENGKVDFESLIPPLRDLGIDVYEYKKEPGFPYCCSLMSKKL